MVQWRTAATVEELVAQARLFSPKKCHKVQEVIGVCVGRVCWRGHGAGLVVPVEIVTLGGGFFFLCEPPPDREFVRLFWI